MTSAEAFGAAGALGAAGASAAAGAAGAAGAAAGAAAGVWARACGTNGATVWASPEWQAKLKTIIPSYGTKLNGNVDATEQELEYTSRVLQLQYVKPQAAADAALKAELKPQAENKPVADIAL